LPVADLADTSYVLLTTRKRSGHEVGTPVWCARDGADLRITTAPDSGKIKRLRHTPQVTLMACSASGKPLAGAEAVAGVARVDESPEAAARTAELLRKKYRLMYRLLHAFQKRDHAPATIIVSDPAVDAEG